MTKFELKPYRLENTIQNYEWGAKNGGAYIPRLLGNETETDKPYAELWIGAHPKAPSKVMVDGNEVKLDELISLYPEEILGKKVIEKFGNKLPFLLKVLSAEKILSIQTHPDKKFAELLHRQDKANYPDDNHKPEIAIAIDELEAFAGFDSDDNIQQFLKWYQYNGNSDDSIKSLFVKMVKSFPEGFDYQKFTEYISEPEGSEEIKHKKEILLSQLKEYKEDLGHITAAFLKYQKLKENEALFLGAGIPHAYIKGNIVECMANSDNVIRAGYTNKFKDVENLIESINFENSRVDVIRPDNPYSYTYKTEAREFEITLLKSDYDHEKMEFATDGRVAVILMINGSGEIRWNEGEEQINIKQGESYLLPAKLWDFEITVNSHSKLFYVTIPEN